jgi:hypothetical protein
MHRTTVMIPHELRLKALRQAQARGVSLGELIRDALESVLEQMPKADSADPFFADKKRYQGDAPPDLSANHDRHLYGEGS